MSRSAKRRNVLVAVAGQTPAVITETLWVLEQQRRVCLDEIRVITTSRGRESITRQLLGKEGGFSRYCTDYGVEPGRIAFSEKSLYLLTDRDGRELADIRDSQDNMAAADQIFSLIRNWTAREEDVLFCSAAGGRKTLGIYLAMALMLCGRLEDSLSHVLVSPVFELGVPDFFYPPPEPRLFRRFVGTGRQAGEELCGQVSSERGQLDLADIPFPRLRELLGGELPLEKGLVEAVARSQLLLGYLQSPPPLRLSLQPGTVEIGQLSLRLSRQLMAIYAFFLRQFNGRGATMQELFSHRQSLAETERQIDRLRTGEQETYAWERMVDVLDFRERISPCISKVNSAIRKALGKNRLANRYEISTGGTYRVDIPNYEILD